MPSSTHRQLLRQVLAALGLGSTAVALSSCQGDAPEEPSDHVDASSDSTPDPGSDRDASLAEKPPVIVVQPPPDADLEAGTYCRSLIVSRNHALEARVCPADGGFDAGDGGDLRFRNNTCLPAPPMGQSCSDTYNEACVLNTYQCGIVLRAQRVLCGPLPGPEEGQCCYIIEGGCAVGRPFLIDGKARFAPVVDDATWSAALRADVETLDAATRAALADAWTQDGLTEHASVASFSRFVLQCLAVGAPADIVERAQRACSDEIEHTRIAFGLASAYAGRPIGPGPLSIAGALDDHLDSADIACSVAAEGCIAELVSASIIAAVRDAASDPIVKTALTRIAEQELDHALLAWRYLAWACSTGDAHLRVRVAAVFDRMHDHVGFGPRTTLPANLSQMRDHGYLPIEERRQIATAVLADVILPAARSLFAIERAPAPHPLA